MLPKKNPRIDVRRNSSLFFAVGLVVMLTMVNYAMNYKSYDKSDLDLGVIKIDQNEELDIPLVEPMNTPPPPAAQAAAPEITIIEDDKPVVETTIQATDTDQDEEIKVEQVIVEEIPEDVPVAFVAIEDAPEYPGCDKGSKAERKACMKDRIGELVRRKFNSDLAADLGLTGVHRIDLFFTISKTGDIVDVKARAPHPKLVEEAIRVAGLLPKMKPGMQRGNPVKVTFNQPIIFKVEE